MESLICKFVYCSISDDLIMIGFADQEYNTKNYILLQKERTSEEERKKIPVDEIAGIHFEYCNQIHSGYNGIKKIQLKRDVVIFELLEEFAKEIQVDQRIEASISTANFDYENLKKSLEIICKDAACFEEII